jgi:hypothetical protein
MGKDNPALAATRDEYSVNAHNQAIDILTFTNLSTRGQVPVASRPDPSYPAAQTREDDQ